MEEANRQLYKALFEFLIRQISDPRKAEQLIQLGHASCEKTTEEVFHTYLLFEKYLTSFEQATYYDRISLREGVRMRFPAILQQSIFHLLFVSETEQKNTLAIQFIQAFLDNASEKFGRTGAGYFEKKSRELEGLDACRQDPESFKRLQSLSFETFHFVSENYGDTLAGKIFERTSASPKNEIIGEIMACGMNDFVSKPFKPNELRSKILEFLETPDALSA